MNIGTLTASLGIDSKQLHQGLSDAERRMDDFGRKVERVGQKMQSMGKNMSKYVTLPLVGLATALTATTMQAASYADEIDKTSQRMGIGMEAFQELTFAGEQLGIKTQTMERALGRLNQRIGRAEEGSGKYADALEAVGMSTEQIKKEQMGTEDVFMTMIRNLHDLDDSSKQAALAGELLGTRTSRDLLPAIKAGGDAIEELSERAHELGIVMGEDTIKELVEFDDMMGEVRKMIEHTSMEFGQVLLPIIRDDILPVLRERLIPAIRGVAVWFGNLTTSTRRIIVVIGAIVAAIGPLLMVFGMLVSLLGKGIIAIKGTVAALNALRIAMMKNPATILAVGIATLVTAIYSLSRASRGAASAQKDFNDELERTERLRQQIEPLARDVETTMETVERLNERQLESLAKDIDRLIELKEDQVEALLAELKKENEALHGQVENYLKYYDEHLRLMEESEKAEDEYTRERLIRQAYQAKRTAAIIKGQLDEEAYATLQEREEFNRRIKQLEEYQNTVTSLLRGLDGEEEIQRELTRWEQLHEQLEQWNQIKTDARTAQQVIEAEQRIEAIEKEIDTKLELERVLLRLANAPPIAPLEAISSPVQVTPMGIDPGLLEFYEEYEKQLDVLARKNEVFGESFDLVENEINATRTALHLLIENFDGLEGSEEKIEKLINKLKELEGQQAKNGEAMFDFSQIIAQAMTDVVTSFAEGIGKMMAGSMDAQDIGKLALGALADMLHQLGQLTVATGLAALSIKEALKLSPAGAIVAGAALIALSAAVKSRLSSMGDSMGGGVPQMAAGGLVHGRTLVEVGEYPGASVNPEVITPLSDLKKHLRDAGGGTPASIEVRMRGDEMYGVWEKERFKKQQLD